MSESQLELALYYAHQVRNQHKFGSVAYREALEHIIAIEAELTRMEGIKCLYSVSE